jgi:Domain of unknown function (DUF4350)
MTTRRSPWIAVGVVAALLIAANLGLRQLDRATRGPGGPPSSSYATQPAGAAAYAELLERYDHPVIRLREPLAEAGLDPATTLVVLEPRGLEQEDGDAVGRFVRDGGRLVYGGRPRAGLLDELGVDLALRPSAGVVAVPVGTGLPGVRQVATTGEGAWLDGTSGAQIPSNSLLQSASRTGALLVEQPVGSGTALLLADPSPVQNRLLGLADNAALGLALAGDRRPVVFAESVHGYGPDSGLGAVPTRWWWVFGGLVLAAVVLALSRGRRLGPPERPDRELPPARVEFAEALATQLAKARPRSDGVATARRVTRRRLARAVRLPPDAPAADVRVAAAARGFEPEVVEAALGSGTGEAELIAVGRALRRIEREESRA